MKNRVPMPPSWNDSDEVNRLIIKAVLYRLGKNTPKHVVIAAVTKDTSWLRELIKEYMEVLEWSSEDAESAKIARIYNWPPRQRHRG